MPATRPGAVAGFVDAHGRDQNAARRPVGQAGRYEWSRTWLRQPRRDAAPSSGRLGWLLALFGTAAAAAALGASPADARSAAAQNWSPFVLVSELLLIGLVADDDGLFAAAGHRLAQTSRSGAALFVGGGDDRVSHRRAQPRHVGRVLDAGPGICGQEPRWTGVRAPLRLLLLSNAGSLFLPGSNLTNLIVLGHLYITGGQFFARMWPAALAALVVTAAVMVLSERRTLRPRTTATAAPAPPPVVGLGLASVVAAAALVVALRSPALPVFVVGAVAITVRLLRGKDQPRRVAGVLGLPVLAGLFGLSIGLGTPDGLGRAGHVAVPSRCLGDSHNGGPLLGPGEQPAGRLSSRRPHATSSLFTSYWVEPGPEPVRDRVTGVVLVAPCGTVYWGGAVATPCQPPGGRGGAAVAGGGGWRPVAHGLVISPAPSRREGVIGFVPATGVADS